MVSLWTLFTTFARIGSFTFGGGYAMLPMIQKEIVDKHGWASATEIADYFAIGQVTPGVIAVNTATFIGHKVRGVRGGIVATLGMIAMPMVIITIITAFLGQFAELAVVRHAFSGIRACICVLIADAVHKLVKQAVSDSVTLTIFALTSFCAIFTVLSPANTILLVLFGGGIVTSLMKREK